MAYEINRSIRMAQYYSGANLTHTLAHIAPKSRPLYVLVDFEVYGNIHGKLTRIIDQSNSTLHITPYAN